MYSSLLVPFVFPISLHSVNIHVCRFSIGTLSLRFHVTFLGFPLHVLLVFLDLFIWWYSSVLLTWTYVLIPPNYPSWRILSFSTLSSRFHILTILLYQVYAHSFSFSSSILHFNCVVFIEYISSALSLTFHHNYFTKYWYYLNDEARIIMWDSNKDYGNVKSTGEVPAN